MYNHSILMGSIMNAQLLLHVYMLVKHLIVVSTKEKDKGEGLGRGGRLSDWCTCSSLEAVMHCQAVCHTYRLAPIRRVSNSKELIMKRTSEESYRSYSHYENGVFTLVRIN